MELVFLFSDIILEHLAEIVIQFYFPYTLSYLLNTWNDVVNAIERVGLKRFNLFIYLFNKPVRNSIKTYIKHYNNCVYQQ